ncbi:MAG: hypothetical protein ACRC2T_00845 [Thermoguttaceae bacterium]
MRIPRQIAFPSEELRIEARQIETELCQIGKTRKFSAGDFEKLDDFVWRVCKEPILY